MFVTSLLLIAAAHVSYVYGGILHHDCDGGIDVTPVIPVRRGYIRYPRGDEIMPLSVFRDQIVGRTLYAYMAGAAPSFGADRFSRTELTFTSLVGNTATFEFSSVFNNSVCVDGSVFSTTSFDAIGDGRASFTTGASGGSIVLFSSRPESYVWLLLCAGYGDRRIPRCEAENLSASLFTLESPPNSVNLERIGNDIRTRTCLNMEDIPGVFLWSFIQGENTCG